MDASNFSKYQVDRYFIYVVKQPHFLNLNCSLMRTLPCLDTPAPILWKFPRKAPRISQPAGPTHIEEEEEEDVEEGEE